jgi:hypothetical protein
MKWHHFQAFCKRNKTDRREFLIDISRVFRVMRESDGKFDAGIDANLLKFLKLCEEFASIYSWNSQSETLFNQRFELERNQQPVFWDKKASRTVQLLIIHSPAWKSRAHLNLQRICRRQKSNFRFTFLIPLFLLSKYSAFFCFIYFSFSRIN